MADPETVANSGDIAIDALLTGYRWDDPNLTFSFPDSGWWYVLEQVKNELSILDLIDVLTDVVTDPLGGLINLLQDFLTTAAGDTLIVSGIALNDFGEFNDAQKLAARFATGAAAAVSGLAFTEVNEGEFELDLDPGIFDGDGLDVGFTHGIIRFAETDSTDAPAFGVPPLTRLKILIGEGFLGDTWYKNDGSFDTPALGNFAFFTIMHELGHALGLKHGHESGLFGENIPAWLGEAITDVNGPDLPDELNSMEFSIMTYRSALDGPNALQAEDFGFAQSLMMLDIAALQYMYGANFDTNATDTVYSWDPATGRMSINGVAQLQPGEGAAGNAADKNRVFLTIWDGNGTDTYDMSNYGTGVSIDLEPGRWSITHDDQRAFLGADNNGLGYTARGNVFNALLFNGDARSLIENARGGAGGDTISGNGVANLLQGNDGNDSILGLADADTLEGGAGADTLDGGDGDDSIDAGSGNDVALGGAGADIIDGGEGNDSLDGGDAGDTLLGGAGNDTILGGDGDDTIAAGDGNDSVLAGPGQDTVTGGEGNDTIDGGTGNSTLSGEGGDDSILAGDADDALSGGEGNDTILAGAGADAVEGGNGDDSVDGGDGDDTIDGAGGNDTIHGAGGADSILGGAGADVVTGGSGSDTIDAGADGDTVDGGDDADLILGAAGDDSLEGGAGDDSIDAGDGDDTASGGEGNDTILGLAGADVLLGGDGADSLDAGIGDDNLAGGDGNDTLLAGAGMDTAAGDGGDDLIHGGDGADTLSGGAGNDELYGEADSDALYGDDGNDTLAGGAAADTLDGGAGIDMASYIDATGPVVINLQDPSQTTGDAAGDLLISIEQFGLSNFDDTFIGLDDPLVPDVVFGRDGNDTLLGFAGDDSLHGEGGDDSIVGGAGADLLDGGAGTDTTSFLESNIGIVVDLVDPSRNTGIALGDQIVSVERFHMSLQNDEFVGLAAAETIFGHHGNDTVFGNDGDDVVLGGEQHDLLWGGAGGDTLLGEAGNDTLEGGDGDDSLLGGDDLDRLVGGAGADTLDGGTGDDHITGDAGDDHIRGGLGRDMFDYAATGWGVDVILDFEDRTDRIAFTGLPGGPGIGAMGDLLIFDRLGASGIETVIQRAGGGLDEIVLVGIDDRQINHQDFLFFSA